MHYLSYVFAGDCKEQEGSLSKIFWRLKYNCVLLFCQGIDSVFEQIVFSYTTLGKGLGHGPVYMFQSDSIVVAAVCEERDWMPVERFISVLQLVDPMGGKSSGSRFFSGETIFTCWT